MNSWTVTRRLVTSFAFLLLLVLVLAGAFSYTLHVIDRRAVAITEHSLPGVIHSYSALNGAYQYRVLTLKYMLTDDARQWESIGHQCDEQAQAILRIIADYQKTIDSPEEQQLFLRIEPALNHYRDLAKQIRHLSAEHKREEANLLMRTTAADAFVAFEKSIADLVSFNEDSAGTAKRQLLSSVSGGQSTSFAVSAVAIGATVTLAFLIIRGITAILRRVSASLGDASAQVASASSQVSASSQSLAQGSNEQAASLEETSASLEEMASMTTRNAENAAQAKAISTETRNAADAGVKNMDAMRSAMGEIKSSSDEIAKIVKTIDEIAFQTNILALNAAVEAARAGEAGAGFAVVAEEVRALAQRSAAAAKETAGKIETAIQKSNQGVKISGGVAQSLGEILEKARQLEGVVSEIAQASNDQNQGIQQVNNAVGQMDRVTQSNAGNAEETAAAAEELNAQAAALRENVADLQRLAGRAASVEEHSASPSRGRWKITSPKVAARAPGATAETAAG